MTETPVLRSAHVRRTPDDAFALFTDEIGAWWPLSTHGLFGERAGGLSFADGQLVERALDGRTTTWGEVLAWDPPHRLVVSWHPGRETGTSSTVEVRFVGDDDGTRVELVHSGWDSFGERAAEVRRSYVGPNAWGYVLDFFGLRADVSVAADELQALIAAYDEFYTEAAAGGFGPPPAGEWTANQVVAHVAANDDGMAAVCRCLIHGGVPTLDNTLANDTSLLEAVVQQAGGRADDLRPLIALARGRSAALVGLLAMLDEQQLATMVACHLVDHGEVVVDQPMPWRALALRTQTGFHLPLHTEQLRSLRDQVD